MIKTHCKSADKYYNQYKKENFQDSLIIFHSIKILSHKLTIISSDYV